MQSGESGNFWLIIEAFATALAVAGAAIVGLIKHIYCRGINDQKIRDENDTLKNEVVSLKTRLDELEDDIKSYRKETASQLKEMNDKLNANGQDIAVIKTILEKNFPS